MRKRRRLSDKMTIMVCAVLIAFSAFFYVPMEVNAEELDYQYSGSSTANSIYGTGGSFCGFDIYVSFNSDLFNNVFENIDSDSYYLVNMDWLLTFSPVYSGYVETFPWYFCPYDSDVSYFSVDSNGGYGDKTWSNNSSFVIKGSSLLDNDYRFRCRIKTNEKISFNYDYMFDYTINSVTALTGEESESYQNGYNVGFSAGQTDGYNNGYSDGFLEGEESGFQAGVDSVDTQSYYDAGYDAGYNQAYSVGYNNGFEAGRDSVTLSKGQWGESVFLGDALNYNLSGSPFYVSSYGLIDMEEYQSGQNGYFYNTVPGTFSGYTDYNFTIPFSTLNNGTMFRIDSDKFEVDFRLSNLRSYLNPNSASATLSANLYNSKIVEAFVTYNGTKFYGQIYNNDDVNFHFQVNSFSDVNWLNDNDMSVTIKVQNNVCLVTDSDISLYVGCEYTPKLLFTLGPSSLSYAVMVRPYYGFDNVSANIQNQTDKLNENSNKNTNSIINGFDNSKGDSVNSDLSAGLNEFQVAEDSLFSTASSILSDYQFFNLSSVPAMVSGISFVSSIMTSWFNQAGGASGVGIVLSILFSIMLVAMVLGLYRWYQSKGGKD